MAVDQTAEAMRQTWTQTVNQVKQDVISPNLWRALESTIPVVWESENFVIGMATSDGTIAGQLHTHEYQSAIERTLRALTGDANLRLRVIEGTEASDWEYTKARDKAAASLSQQAVQRKTREAGAFASWDEIYDQISRLWASAEFRGLPSGRGRFLDSALSLVEQAMDSLYPAGVAADKPADEQIERGLSRVIERVASMTNSDATIIAFLVMERRRKK